MMRRSVISVLLIELSEPAQTKLDRPSLGSKANTPLSMRESVVGCSRTSSKGVAPAQILPKSDNTPRLR